MENYLAITEAGEKVTSTFVGGKEITIKTIENAQTAIQDFLRLELNFAHLSITTIKNQSSYGRFCYRLISEIIEPTQLNCGIFSSIMKWVEVTGDLYLRRGVETDFPELVMLFRGGLSYKHTDNGSNGHDFPFILGVTAGGEIWKIVDGKKVD